MRYLSDIIELDPYVSTVRFERWTPRPEVIGGFYHPPSDLIALLPIIMHPQMDPEDPDKFKPIECWLEYLDHRDLLAFAVRQPTPPIPEHQTPQSWMALPTFPARWNYKDVICHRAVATRYPGGRVGIVQLHRGLLWTMVPPTPTP